MGNLNLVLIDKSSLMHQAYHSFPHLHHRGLHTGILYGFVRSVCSYTSWIIDNFGLARVASCQDSKPYLRSKIFKGYKASREKPDIEKVRLFRDASNQISEFCKYAYISDVAYPGLEADDLIAILADKYEEEYENIFMVSSDTDMYQLLDQENLHMVKGKASKPKLYSKKDFFAEYPTLPDARTWYKVSVLTGGHNGLPGIDGIGIKKAVAYWSGIAKPKDSEKIESNLPRLNKYYRLALLPIFDMDYFDRVSLSNEEYDGHDDLVYFFEDKGFTGIPKIIQSLGKLSI